MILTLYIIIAWFVLVYCITTLPRIYLIKNIILYMLLIIFMVSASTILPLDFGLIEFTKDKVKYVAVTLCRDITTPLLLVILCNFFTEVKTYAKKIASIVIILFLISMLEFVNLQFKLHAYVKWNFMMCIVFYVLFTFIALLINKGLYALQKRGGLNK